MKICMTEPAKTKGSIGCYYIMYYARQAGFEIDYEPENCDYDVELISVHHFTDLYRLAELPRKGKIRILGGHPTVANPIPFIQYADVVFRGEGEEWIVEALTRLKKNLDAKELQDLHGTIICKDFKGILPESVHLRKLPELPLYLNESHEEGHATNYYIEMARGCPHKCNYCELGWGWPFRLQKTDYILSLIDKMDKKITNKVTLFAPDESSHPGYFTCLERINQRGFVTSFGSMRLDTLLKSKINLPKNMLIRVGIDGLTQATRYFVNKKISNKAIVEYFRIMIKQGYRNFKAFMIFGYPWEELSDFDEFEMVMDAVFEIEVSVNVHLRIKFTPLIPNPITPLSHVTAKYDGKMVKRIINWFKEHKRPYRYPGWYPKSDGIMSRENHARQCNITKYGF